jgi:thymidine phosphorylase
MCLLSGRVADRAEGVGLLRRAWEEGRGYERFQRMVEAQGGDPQALDRPGLLPVAVRRLDIPAPRAGRFRGVRARPAGEWITEAGGGRLRTGDRIDPRVGIEILAESGNRVGPGEIVLRLHLGEKAIPDDAGLQAAEWIVIDDGPTAVDGPGHRELERIDSAEPS